MDGSLNFNVLAEDNIRTLKVSSQTFPKPLSIILVGYPGAGKTFLVERFKNETPVTTFSEKNLTDFLAPRATPLKREATEVFQLAVKTIEHLLIKGKACVYDGNLKTREQRELVKKVVEDAGGRYLLISIDTPKEICYSRVQKQNLAVGRGEAKGFILDKDLFEYEVATTKLPPLEESHYIFDGQTQESLVRTILYVKNLLYAA